MNCPTRSALGLMSLAALVLAATRPAAADVAYDTFSASFGYETQAGTNVTGAASSPGYTDTADQFVALAGGAVTDIWVPIASVAGSNAFEVLLMSDVQNQPGTVLASWVVTGQGFAFDGAYHEPIHLSISGGPELEAGTPYWLNLHAAADDAHMAWMFTRPPIFENVAQRFAPNGAWNVLQPGFTSAYRIDVLVPEPAGGSVGLALGLLATRRRRQAA